MKRVHTIAAVVALAAAAWFGVTEAPHWQGDGTRAILGTPLQAANANQLDPASFARIAIEGDSNVLADRLGASPTGRGHRRSGRCSNARSAAGWR